MLFSEALLLIDTIVMMGPEWYVLSMSSYVTGNPSKQAPMYQLQIVYCDPVSDKYLTVHVKSAQQFHVWYGMYFQSDLNGLRGINK